MFLGHGEQSCMLIITVCASVGPAGQPWQRKLADMIFCYEATISIKVQSTLLQIASQSSFK